MQHLNNVIIIDQLMIGTPFAHTSTILSLQLYIPYNVLN